MEARKANLEALQRELGEWRLAMSVPMERYTSFRVGGMALGLLEPESVMEVCVAIDACGKSGTPYFVMGQGSNLIVRDEGFPGCVIRLAESFSSVEFEGTRVIAQAGTSLKALMSAALSQGLAGLEWAGGIPGTLGGAVAMNAGAYGLEIADVLQEVTILRAGRVERVSVERGMMGYRASPFGAPACVVLEAVLSLCPDEGGARERSRAYAKRRRESQPLQYPSAGSVFKRPQGQFAGALIEAAGLKGACIGGAQVSEKHAGFIINRGGARAADVLSLIELVRRRVKEHAGVELELEVKIIGGEGV